MFVCKIFLANSFAWWNNRQIVDLCMSTQQTIKFFKSENKIVLYGVHLLNYVIKVEC